MGEGEGVRPPPSFFFSVILIFLIVFKDSFNKTTSETEAFWVIFVKNKSRTHHMTFFPSKLIEIQINVVNHNRVVVKGGQVLFLKV